MAMDPHKVFTTDRRKFNQDLDVLIDTAAAAASSASSSHVTSPSTACTSPTPAVDPRLRKRPSEPQPSASKKVKTDTSINSGIPASPARFQPTDANTIPLGNPNAGNETWSTLRNAVRRQWDSRKDDLAYEQLVEKRRAERLINVDRYIPGDPPTLASPPVRRTSRIMKPFPFDKLPDKIQDKILELLLVAESPLQVDFTWLRPFMHGHCRIPSTTKTLKIDSISYTVPLEWTNLLDVSVMSV